MREDMFARIFDARVSFERGGVSFQGVDIAEINGILRFSPSVSYSSGNFSKLREQHALLQLDSENGTSDRLDTILQRTRWPRDYFKDKLILECGCGAGADTEVLLSLGARVISVDIAGVDVCKRNMKGHPSSEIIQASIMDLPFKPQAFDIVWCHRVIQHTPDPAGVLDHILQFVRPDGAVFIHSYSLSAQQMLSWKYVFRPVTRRMDPELLYRLITKLAPSLLEFTSALRLVRPEVLGRFLFMLAHQIVPIRNYRFEEKFLGKSEEFILEYAVHDTFDCLSPRYDRPLSKRAFRKAAQRYLKSDFEVVECGVTLLRSIVR